MRIDILVSGAVAQTPGAKLAELGLDAGSGTRQENKLDEWQGKVGSHGAAGNFARAASSVEIPFNWMAGEPAGNQKGW